MQIAHSAPRTAILPIVFTGTIFASACLLFFVQPMFAKLVLPNLGGSSAVWTTAMLFFQTVLILGYLYAHLSVRYLPTKAQIALHLCLWAAALAFLPIAVPEGWYFNPDKPAVIQTLAVFALGVGVPFAVLSATAPLLQAWYGRAGAPGADDPYFLYGASNLGSLLSLLAFPLIAEPLFGVNAIRSGWAALYMVLGAGLLVCGLSMLGRQTGLRVTPTEPEADVKLDAAQIGRWLFLAFLPSSLMLSTTSTISTDVGSFPLVWVVPLALYLLSFVFAFSSARWPGGATIEKLFLVFFTYILILMAGDLTARLGWLSFGALVLFFFIASVLSHRRLYVARPAQKHLTAFYVTMSVGGALGGLFNSILAPLLFNDVYEGPLTLVATAFLLGGMRGRMQDIGHGLAGSLLCAAPGALALWVDGGFRIATALTVIAALLVLWRARQRPLVAATLATCLLALGQMVLAPKAIWQERSFFGSYRVSDEKSVRTLSHGTTIHGAQPLEDLGKTPRATTYYSPNGPLARVLVGGSSKAGARVGVIGLGVGALSCYRKPGQDWHFYEIDAVVDRIARDARLFDFMDKCAADVPTHIGDARIVLAHQDLAFDVLIIDAYSSDAIPVHLMTTDAMRTYLDRLSADGVIAFHVSNRFFDLEPVVARIARDLGLSAATEAYTPPADSTWPGETASNVVVVARDKAHLAKVTKTGDWTALVADARAAWSDDHANLLGALR